MIQMKKNPMGYGCTLTLALYRALGEAVAKRSSDDRKVNFYQVTPYSSIDTLGTVRTNRDQYRGIPLLRLLDSSLKNLLFLSLLLFNYVFFLEFLFNKNTDSLYDKSHLSWFLY